MRYLKYFAVVLTFIVLFVVPVYGEETKQETKPGATTQEADQTVKPGAGPEVKQETKKEEARDPAGKEKRLVATIGPDGVQHVDVIGGGYFFDPNYIVVKVNVPVELKVKKEPGATPHSIVSKAPEAGIDFAASLSTEPTIIKFTPKKTGKYPFFCDKRLLFFKSHKDRGMEGVVEVVE